MSTATLGIANPSSEHAGSPWLFASALLVVAASFALLAGWAPLGVSIVAVFLFAGPHNWFEGRYFLTRMPARWGKLRAFFTTGILGVLALTGAFAALPTLGRLGQWDGEAWDIALATWNTAFVVWIAALVWMRSRQNPKRDWPWLVPASAGVISLAWLWPAAWDLSLVYIHPLVALWFLDRELGKQQPAWQAAYRRVLPVVPLLLGVLWWRLAASANLPGDDALTMRITYHAGSDLLSGVSSHLLVASHVFLEMLHYGVWLVAIPLVAFRTAPWQISQVPLARRGAIWRRAVAGALAIGLLVVFAFWAGFLANYPLTRDVYFTVAMAHVLAEVPFLLRLL